jgi:hypothetical protein
MLSSDSGSCFTLVISSSSVFFIDWHVSMCSKLFESSSGNMQFELGKRLEDSDDIFSNSVQKQKLL